MSQLPTAETSEALDDYDPSYVITDTEDESGSDAAESPGSESPPVDLAHLRITASGHIYLADEGVLSKVFSRSFLRKHEIPRKAFHSLQGFLTLYLYVAGVKPVQVAKVLWVLLAATAGFEVVRLRSRAVNRCAYRLVKDVMRPEEYDSVNGIVYFLAGVALNMTFASKDIATVTTLLLSWADTAASTVGRAYGRYTPQVCKGKSVAGCLASAVTGYLVCLLFYGYVVPACGPVNEAGDLAWTARSSQMSLHTFALAMGLVTSASEAIDLPGLDDNLTIPVGSALALSWLIKLTRAALV